jgi:alkyl sulfatase BDS1-like metallo-beta-lactamase superfamily hydrolase
VADALQLSDELWRGVREAGSPHPFAFTGALVEPRDGVAFVPSFANVSAFSTDEGLVLVDTGSLPFGPSARDELRRWSPARVDTAVYSHGHIDHVFGVPLYEAEAAANGWRPPVVVAHEAIAARFDRYVLTAGWNAAINRRQFQLPGLEWPTTYRYPDRTYRDRLELEVGGVTLVLHHALGETDDHTWTHVPQLGVICTGDLFIWASPNAGNPQKVQRYPREWAMALREMLALDPPPEILLPGHGLPLVGPDRVRQALEDTASLLESLVEQTLRLMNEGARLDEVLHSVTPPAELMERPYLRPVYDEPEFVVRNIWRLYGGWWDGDPSSLSPAPASQLALEIAQLAGGAGRLAARAGELAEQGELRLACHLAEMASAAAPADPAVQQAYAAVYAARAAAAGSTMARGVFAAAAADGRMRLESSAQACPPEGDDR